MPIDYGEYPPDWNERRARILARANDRCEQCHVPNGAVVSRLPGGMWFIDPDGVRIVLTIAHMDHDKANWDVKDTRLRAWCQRCHLRYDRPRHVAKARATRRARAREIQPKLDLFP